MRIITHAGSALLSVTLMIWAYRLSVTPDVLGPIVYGVVILPTRLHAIVVHALRAVAP